MRHGTSASLPHAIMLPVNVTPPIRIANTIETSAITSCSGVGVSRPAVTGDGSTVLYVDDRQDLCLSETATPGTGGCLGFPGQVQAVALSPDGRLGAFIFIDARTGQPDNRISVIDLVDSRSQTFELLAPAVDGVVLVVRGHRTDRQVTCEALERLHFMKAKMIGVVLNGVDPDSSYYHSYAYYFAA